MSERSSLFVNADVFAPTSMQPYFQRYSQSTGASTLADLNRKPFPRMVDFWFLAVCVAIKLALKPVKVEGQTYKAIDGAALVSPEWRIDALKLIAIGETGDVAVVNDARRVMEIANGLAFAGMPHLIEILEENPDDEALGLGDSLAEMCK